MNENVQYTPEPLPREHIHNEPLPLDLVAVTEYVRTLVRNHVDRSQLSLDVGVKYNTLNYFIANHGSTLRVSDLQKLMEHFGLARPPSAS